MKCKISFPSDVLEVGKSTIVELYVYNDEEGEIVIESIRGFDSYYFDVRFASGIAKTLYPDEYWTYYLEIVPKREGSPLLNISIEYTKPNRSTGRYVVIKDYQLVIKKGEHTKQVNLSFEVLPNEIETEMGKEFSFQILIKNLSSEDTYILDKITGLLPPSFKVTFSSFGNAYPTKFDLGMYRLNPGSLLTIDVKVECPKYTDILRYDMRPQLFVKLEGKETKIVNSSGITIKVKIIPLFVNVHKINDEASIIIPSDIARKINISESGKAAIILSSAGLMVYNPFEVLRDPFEQLKWKLTKLYWEKENLSYMVLNGKISKSEFKKNIKRIEETINEISQRINSLEQKLSVPEIALRFSGDSELSFNEMAEIEKFDILAKKKDLAISLVKWMVDRYKELLKFREKLNQKDAQKLFSEEDLINLEDSIELELSEISQAIEEIKDILKDIAIE